MRLKTKECQELIRGLSEGRWTGREMLEEKRRREDMQASFFFIRAACSTAEERKEARHVSQM